MSIKVCVISPASHLNRFSSLGDCEMALTHLIVPGVGFEHTKHVTENYVDYFKKCTKAGRWTILDNSAYEIGKLEAEKATGEGLGPELVLKAAELINPSIVIAQDILTDREATLEATKDFIKYVKKQRLEGKFQLMGVAQGKTEDEWLASYQDLLGLAEIDQIGFSKIAVPLSFGGNQAEDGCVAKSRLKATEAVNSNFGTQAKKAHLLGGDNWLPWELKQQTKYDWIYSNDSSATVWYGMHGKVYDSFSGKIDKIITKKPDLENHQPSTQFLLDEAAEEICNNISILHSHSKG